MRARDKAVIIILQTGKKARIEVSIMFWIMKTICNVSIVLTKIKRSVTTNASLCLLATIGLLAVSGRNAYSDFRFGEPTNLGPTVNSSADDAAPSISADSLSLFFVSRRPGGSGSADLWVTTRASTEDAWGSPVNLGSMVNSSVRDGAPDISSDGCSLYFNSYNGQGNMDMWVTTRVSISETWSKRINLGSTINISHWDAGPSISADGLSLYFDSERPGAVGGQDIWVTFRTTIDDPWGEPVSLGPIVNSSLDDWNPSISADELALFFVSDWDLWMATRPTKEEAWGSPVNLGPNINTHQDITPDISFDGSTLYFCSNRPEGTGGMDIWQVSIEPIIDFNSDDIVDSADMCIMVDNWGTDNSLCDIGPMPWGDGIVDVQDLIVLAQHLFEDYRLAAHWKLDEKAGDIAYDSVGEHDATVYGEPFWQPASGRYVGALEFDGIDDYISTPFVLNPGNGSLSAFAWIKGGSPGQVIISQTGDFGDTWLSIDSSDKLMTGFSGIYFGDLVSGTVTTDGQWHHVGFVYDMGTFHRQLYVDGALVAEDATVVSGMPSDGGLNIGASKGLNAGTYFSGLIDDVRIYNQALSAEEIAALTQ